MSLTAAEERIEEKVNISLEASEAFNKLVSRATNHLEWCKGSADRRNFENRCVDAQNFWKGDHWSGIKSYSVPGRSAARKKVKPCPVDNFFFSQVEGILGDVCNQPADIVVQPKEENDEDIAKEYDDIAQHIWAVNRGDDSLKFQARRGILYGPLAAKVYWDTEWSGGVNNPYVGEVHINLFPATQLFVDPRIKAMEPGVIQQAAFAIYAVRKSLAYIQDMYPAAGGQVTADSYASYVSVLDPLEASTFSIDPNDSSALLIEYYYRGKPLADKFPANLEYDEFRDNRGNGVHLAVIAGNVLLRHVPYIAPKYPLVLEWMYPSDDSIYGYGDGHHMLMPQLVINKNNEIAVEGNSIQAYGNWVTDEGNVRDVGTFQRLAQIGGSLLTFVDSSRARRDMAGGVAGSVFNQYSQSQRAMETVTGRLDISQGRAPRGIRAASAISMLLNQAAGRTKSRSDSVSSFVQQIMEQAIMLAGKYYTTDRIVRLTGEEGKTIWKTIPADNLRKTRTWTDPETGLTKSEDYIPEFDIKVIAGAETPTYRAYYAELATEMYKAGAIDQEALLEAHKFPHWREVLTRMKGAQPPVGTPAPSVSVPSGNPLGAPSGAPQGQPSNQGLPPEVLEALLSGGEQGSLAGGPPAGMTGIPEVDEMIQQMLEAGIPEDQIEDFLISMVQEMQGGMPQGGMPQGGMPQGGMPQGGMPQGRGDVGLLGKLVNSFQRTLGR